LTGPAAASRRASYLDQVAAGLAGPRRHRVRILAELADGLDQAVADHVAAGASPERAVTAAIAAFGSPREVVAGFAGELATRYARQTTWWLAGTGPLIGVWWLLLRHPGGLPAGPGALSAVVPALPLVAVGLAIAAGVVTTTGRLTRWLPETGPGRALAAVRAVAALAATVDLTMIAVLAQSGAPARPLAAAAVTASLVRIGCCALVVHRATVLRSRLDEPAGAARRA
jgi:hypothetical protein